MLIREIDQRPPCRSKGGRHWILRRLPRCIVHDQQRLHVSFLGHGGRSYQTGACDRVLNLLGVSTAWGLGVIIGPAIGGYLAQPAKLYLHLFHENSAFARFPYLLPCLWISLFATVAFISCAWLPITIITGTSLLQNNAVPQEQRSAANGIATTAMSLFKAAAPAGAGIIFSWAQKRQHAAFFPGDQMMFLLLNLTEVIGLMMTFKPFLAVPRQDK